MRIDEVIARSAKLFADRLAVLDGDDARSFRELEADVAKLAAKLVARGIGPGDRVLVSVSTGIRGIATLYALSRTGAVSVPINEFWTAGEVESVVGRSGAVDAVVDARLGSSERPLPIALAALDPDQRPRLVEVGDNLGLSIEGSRPRTPPTHSDDADIAMLLFTSGSTSAPKGALLTHRGLVGTAHYVGLAGEITEVDRCIHMLPHYHVGGVVDGILSPHLKGAASIPVRFNPERILEIFEREHATLLIGFDSMIDAVLATPGYSPKRHPHWTTAMITGSEATRDRLLDAGVTRIVTGYGMTETCGLAASTRPNQPEHARRASHWIPVPGIRTKIIEPGTDEPVAEGEAGELAVKGWSLFAGYIDDIAWQDSEGYLRTGDRVRLQAEGAFTFEGRLKEMLKSGGENVSCHEVEDFLMDAIPSARSVVVVGVPDERWGQAVVAVVEFDPQEVLTEAQVRELCVGKLSAYKIPKHVIAMEPGAWPLMATGKVDRSALGDDATKQLRPNASAVRA